MLLCAVSAINIWAQQESTDDPFVSLLPARQVKEGEKQNTTVVGPPQISIEGVLWDSDTPGAIIDGDVYKVGDALKRLDAKVYKIEKNKVFIFYSGTLFEMNITKKEVK
jgi:type II secretory pathway component PulC